MDDLTRPGKKTEKFPGGSKKENGRMACPERPGARTLGDGVIGPKVDKGSDPFVNFA